MPRSKKGYGRVLPHDDDDSHVGSRAGSRVGGRRKGTAGGPSADLEGLQRFPGMGGGIVDDVTRRRSFCVKDYTTGIRHASKTLSAALFMLFATLFSTVALGALVEHETDSRIGLSEYLLMNCVAGVAHSLLGCQPLLVLRPTGPITAITIKLSKLADEFKLDFNQYLAATGVWIGVLMVLCAALELSRHIRRITPFTHDIFACFVCSIYVVDGVRDVLGRFDGRPAHFGEALFAANLSLLTFGASMWLSGARRWRLLSAGARGMIADYAVTIAVVLTTLVSFGPRTVEVERISLPSDFSPTCFTVAPGAECAPEEEAGARQHARPWQISYDGTSPKLWLLAFVSAVPITFFFYMDQNISSLLCQLPKYNLTRGNYYHSSFLAMGVFNAVGPAFGLPFVTGSLPHSPQFVRALTHTTPRGQPSVAEGRVAPLLMYLGIGVPLLLPGLVRLMPQAAIDGVLAYVGVEGILETQLFQRLLLVATPHSQHPPAHQRLRVASVHLFSAMQLTLLGLCWAINLSPFGLFVSFLIVALVPAREHVLPSLFSAAELAVLDQVIAVEAADDDDDDERACADDHFDAEELDME